MQQYQIKWDGHSAAGDGFYPASKGSYLFKGPVWGKRRNEETTVIEEVIKPQEFKTEE
jgi:hypothetical protein